VIWREAQYSPQPGATRSPVPPRSVHAVRRAPGANEPSCSSLGCEFDGRDHRPRKRAAPAPRVQRQARPIPGVLPECKGQERRREPEDEHRQCAPTFHDQKQRAGATRKIAFEGLIAIDQPARQSCSCGRLPAGRVDRAEAGRTRRPGARRSQGSRAPRSARGPAAAVDLRVLLVVARLYEQDSEGKGRRSRPARRSSRTVGPRDLAGDPVHTQKRDRGAGSP